MTLRLALVGCGYFSRFHQDAWSRIKEVEVVGISDADPQRLAAAAGLFPRAQSLLDANAMLDAVRPNVVDIVTPPATHRALVMAATAREIVTICQKPLAPNYEEAVGIVEHAESTGTQLIVHENFRFMPWFREAARLVASGCIGRPLNITFLLRPGDGQGPRAYLDRQPYFQTMERFLIHETAIHLIDVFRVILGEITGVFARVRRLNPVIAGEDACTLLFDFENGATGLFDGNRLLDHDAEDTRMTNGIMLVEGTEGAIRLDGEGRLFFRPRSGRERQHEYVWEKRGYGGDCVYLQCRHIADHLLFGSPVANTGRDYLRNLALEEAAYRSAAEQRFVTPSDSR